MNDFVERGDFKVADFWLDEGIYIVHDPAANPKRVVMLVNGRRVESSPMKFLNQFLTEMTGFNMSLRGMLNRKRSKVSSEQGQTYNLDVHVEPVPCKRCHSQVTITYLPEGLCPSCATGDINEY
jgi:hypothetical protein